MSSEPRRPLFFALRIAIWYATLFVAGSIAIVLLTYYLTAVSLAQRDQQIIKGKLGDYAAAYVRGGARVLAATVRAEQQAAPERLFVRVVDRGVESIVLSDPEGWDPSKLEIVSASGGWHPRPGRQEHRSARGSAGAVSRRARPGHAVDRRRRPDRRLAGDAVGAGADPPAGVRGPTDHPHRPHRRARAARRIGRRARRAHLAVQHHARQDRGARHG